MKLGKGLMGAGLLGASMLVACSQTEQASNDNQVEGTDTATLVAALSANSDGSGDTWFDAAGGEPVRVMGCGFGHILSRVVKHFDADQSGDLDGEERADLVEDFGDGAAADAADDAADDAVADDAAEEGDAASVKGDAGAGRGHGHGRRHGRVAMLLSVYDADGSGTLEAAELEQLKADIEARCEARKAKLVEEFDADGDGTLSEEEWATAHAALRERFAQHHAERVRELDADGDGALDPSEEQDADEAADTERSDAEQSFDTDGDGELDASEQGELQTRGRECVREDRPMMSRSGPGGHGVPDGRTPPAAEEAGDDGDDEAEPVATPS